MRYSFLLAASVLALAACSKPAAPGAETGAASAKAPAAVQGPFEEVAIESFTVPAPVAAGTDLWSGLQSGGSATLKVDACAADSPTQAALMSIMCGESYKVFFDGKSLRWGAIGKNGALAANGAAQPVSAYLNPGQLFPQQREVVVWGLSFGLDDAYAAKIADGSVVGKLEHSAN